MHKTDIIKNALGCLIKKISVQENCQVGLKSWISSPQIKARKAYTLDSAHVPLQCNFYLLQSLHNVPYQFMHSGMSQSWGSILNLD